MKKNCKIIRCELCYRLEVDGRVYNFLGQDIADLFKDLYTKLGYNVELLTE